MPQTLFFEILHFFKRYPVGCAPVILGFSGGLDSMALFYLLLEYKKKKDLNLYAVYIDHGWRSESALEREKLAELCKSYDIPYRYIVLDKEMTNSNLEEKARLKRLSAFSELYQEIGAEALILAHQKEDVAETVLKRILESSSFLNWKGLHEENALMGMRVLRPLLKISKKKLQVFLEEGKKSWFEDSTNEDVHFLRARMRKEFFPEAEKVFGKNIGDNLVELSDMASLLEEFFAKDLEHKHVIENEGDQILLNWKEALHPLQRRFLIDRLCRTENLFLSREIKKELSFYEGNTPKEYHTKHCHVAIQGSIIRFKKR